MLVQPAAMIQAYTYSRLVKYKCHIVHGNQVLKTGWTGRKRLRTVLKDDELCPRCERRLEERMCRTQDWLQDRKDFKTEVIHIYRNDEEPMTSPEWPLFTESESSKESGEDRKQTSASDKEGDPFLGTSLPTGSGAGELSAVHQRDAGRPLTCPEEGDTLPLSVGVVPQKSRRQSRRGGAKQGRLRTHSPKTKTAVEGRRARASKAGRQPNNYQTKSLAAIRRR
ncbi:hypothetical protein L209DRAFT_474797 [Thermothelomyces heterothallicus CBS 203.75]